MGDLVACPFCEKNFNGMSLMESHAFDAHSGELFGHDYNEESVESPLLRCKICGHSWWKQKKPARTIMRHLHTEGGLVNHIIRVKIFDEIPPPF